LITGIRLICINPGGTLGALSIREHFYIFCEKSCYHRAANSRRMGDPAPENRMCDLLSVTVPRRNEKELPERTRVDT
jgi:hypothetical protein